MHPLDEIDVLELPPSVEGCEDCQRIGDKWLHLRICSCGGALVGVTARRERHQVRAGERRNATHGELAVAPGRVRV